MALQRIFALAGMVVVLVTAPLAHAQDLPGLSAQDQADVDHAIAYMQGIDQVKGRFVQTDWGGVQTAGSFYLQRPGKARFVYDAPSGLLVVADGRNVSVSDSRLKTFDRYPLGSTPLSLFLAKDVRFDKGVAVTRVDPDGDGFMLTARDAAHPNQGQVVLTFNGAPLRLRNWRITDRQGRVTEVRITEIQSVSGLDPSLFVLDDPRGR